MVAFNHDSNLLKGLLAGHTRMFACVGCGEPAADVLALDELRPLPRSSKQVAQMAETATAELFAPLIRHSHFGYVLFGSKPLASASIPHDSVRPRLEDPSTRAFLSQLMEFGPLLNQFRSHCFAMRIFEPATEDAAQEVILFNRQRVAQVVSDSYNLFARAFSANVDGEQICDRLLCSNSLMGALTDNENVYREDLLGLLHGFPPKSILAFPYRDRGSRAAKDMSREKLPVTHQEIKPVRFWAAPDDAHATALRERFETERGIITDIMRRADWPRKVLACFGIN